MSYKLVLGESLWIPLFYLLRSTYICLTNRLELINYQPKNQNLHV